MPHAKTVVSARQSTGASRVLFAFTIFLSACLLFLVQPLISKLILPWFGGSAAVWITCMLFFQVVLLLGYAYAHFLTTHLTPPTQAAVHTGLLLFSLLTLPIFPNSGWQPNGVPDPTWRVFAVLATSVGLPYLLLSSTTPLLQCWYARQRTGSIPYRYFALSNAASLIALFSYPVIIEPAFTGHEQGLAWSIAYAFFVALCIAAAASAFKVSSEQAVAATFAETRLSLTQTIVWLGLAAGASSLLLAVTNLLTQNIAPMPLLWVLPLGIYLLTFTLCFESGRWYRRILFLPLLLPAIGCLVATTGALNNRSLPIMIPTLIAALFVCCMVCHGELAKSKPAPEHLTAFYLSLAGGGALGGVAVGLFAPHFFSAMFEYPIVFVFCPAIVLVVLWREHSCWKRPALLAPFFWGACAVSVVLVGYVSHQTWKQVKSSTYLARNFYGALRVDDFTEYHHKVRQLTHGTIVHGLEIENPLFRQTPTSYYGWDSGIGLTWRTLRTGGPLRMGVVGLGTGTLATYGRAGDTIRFYDINPLVPKIAANYFDYLSGTPAHIDIELGDARLTLAREPSQQFDILAIDAFSGDAIPVHLLSREAFQIYRRHLKPDGVLAVHVSNRYLDLAPIAALGARSAGLTARLIDSEDDDHAEIYTATWVLASRTSSFFESPLLKKEALLIQIPRHLQAWTDDYSNLWQVLDFSHE